MSRCKCEFDGDLATPEHRRHHRAWETIPAEPAVDRAYALTLLRSHADLQAQIDYLAACLHDDRLELPMTPGIQAALVRAGQERRGVARKPTQEPLS